MTNEPIVMERTYNAPVSKVWAALTDNNEMGKWYFKIPAFKLEVGFEFEFTAGAKDQEQFRHLCKIIEIVPEKKFTYSWRYDGYEGDSFVTFELWPDGDGTKLKLTHKGLESFPITANNAFAKANFVEGWTYITGTSLKKFVETA